MKIYVNGCSFTYGDELITPATSSWPALLAQKLNAEVVNDAVSGGTNYRTVYRTIKNSKEDFDLYIIAWTTYARFTFYKSNNNFEINFNPQLKNNIYGSENFYTAWGETLYKVWYNELYSFKLWLQQIIQLQAVIDKPLLMINTMHNNIAKWFSPNDTFISNTKSLINFDIMPDEEILAEYEEIQYYSSLIDKNNFYNWGRFYIMQLCDQFPCGPGGHILESGHQCLSELIYKHLCSK
jgi:hypothetical protein